VTTLLYPTPANTQQYAYDLDEDLGSPTPVPVTTLEVTQAFITAESPSFPGYNGLGTELELPGASPDPSNPKVLDYPTLQEGLQAAVDELSGAGPQTTALAPQFVKDVKAGNATKSQLITDVLNSDWDGSPDTYDADTIATILKQPKPLGTGSAAAGASTAATATTTSFLGSARHDAASAADDLNPLTWPGKIVGSAASAVAGSVGTYILKGILTLLGGGLIFYGATLFTDRQQSGGPIGATGGAAEGVAEDPFELFAAAA
jgi:hypothetical protein